MPVPIDKQPNRNTNGFDKNPQNINRSGANRKTWSSINKELEAKGIKPVTKATYQESVTRIINMTEIEIAEMEADENTPLWMKLLLRRIQSNGGEKIMAEQLDRIYGKAIQTNVNIETDDIKQLEDEQLENEILELTNDIKQSRSGSEKEAS